MPAESEHHPSALLVMVEANLMLGDLESALEVLRAGEKRYPDRSAFRLGRITTLMRENRFDDAREALAEARAEADDELLPYLRRIGASLHREDLKAIRKRLLAARSEPDEAKRHLVVQEAATENEAILAASRALVEEDRDDAALWQALSEVYLRLGRASEAIEQLEQAVEEDPERRALLPLIAQLKTGLGEMDAAEQVLVDLATESASPSASYMLARFYLSLDRPLDAAQVLGEAAVDFPDVPMLHMQLAEAWLAADNLDEARAEFGRFRDAAPRDPNVRFLQARIELEEGDFKAAAARLLAVVPELDQAASQFWLGRALELSGDIEGARRRYAVAIVRDPSLPAPYRASIDLAVRRGAWREVGALAQCLIARMPGEVRAWRALTSSLLNLGEAKPA